MWTQPLAFSVDSLKDMISRFIQETGETDRSVDSVLSQAERANEDDLLWLAFDNNKLCGFFFCEVQQGEEDEPVLVLNALYIKPGCPYARPMDEIDRIIDEAATSRGIKHLGFYTRRNPEAFMRRLGYRWKLDSYVFKRAVREGI